MRVPLFPLNAVLFPGGVLPLRVFETRYMDMARECLKNKTAFGVCLIREGREVGSPAVPHPVGCLAGIARWDMPQLGVLQLRTIGQERFRILESQSTAQGLLIGEVDVLAAEHDCPVPRDYVRWAELLRRTIEGQAEELFSPPYRYDSAAWVGYRVAEISPLPLQKKQELLEMNDGVARLSALREILEGPRR